MNFEDLLHPAVASSALEQWRNRHYRDAVLNSVIALFDLLRARTGLQMDGAELAERAFSERKPYLVTGDLSTESGRNSQIGVMLLARGLYQGVRSPGVHSTAKSWTAEQAARLMVTASAIAQLIDDAQQGDVLRFDGVYVATSSDDTNIVRFFEDGNVLRVSVSRGVDDDWVPDWLTLDWAEWQGKRKDQYRGTYEVDGKWIRFTIQTLGGEIRCEGQVAGPSIRVRTHGTATGHRSEKTYHFRPYPRPGSQRGVEVDD
jgi:uncharacterized protein (TIGR02391 family)